MDEKQEHDLALALEAIVAELAALREQVERVSAQLDETNRMLVELNRSQWS